MKRLAIAVAAVALVAAGCSTDAQVASENISKECDQFQCVRRIVFFNGITDKYLLEIQGRCSIAPDTASRKLDVTCKVGDGDGQFKKHFLGLSDNVSYFVEQVEPASVSTNHYKVIFKPEVIVPDIDRPNG